jgi:VanZ family protein
MCVYTYVHVQIFEYLLCVKYSTLITDSQTESPQERLLPCTHVLHKFLLSTYRVLILRNTALNPRRGILEVMEQRFKEVKIVPQ